MTVALIVYLVFLLLIAVRSARRVKDVPDFFVARKGASAKAVKKARKSMTEMSGIAAACRIT